MNRDLFDETPLSLSKLGQSTEKKESQTERDRERERGIIFNNNYSTNTILILNKLYSVSFWFLKIILSNEKNKEGW